MKIILELDGPVFDVEPVYWAAYSRAAGELGMARKDRRVYWNAVRRGAGVGDMLVGAKPRHLVRYRERFPEWLETDECLAEAVAHQCAADELRALEVGGHAMSLVTLGSNAAARQKLLDSADLSKYFSRMARMVSDPFQRIAQMKELAEEHPRVLVVASSEPLVKLANEADLIVVGVSSGPCIGRRLTQAGARMTFGDLEELGNELASGARALVAAGLPPRAGTTDQRGD